ncbi:MAG TPA: hypothetical protein ACFYD1_03465, partial [Candidatus Hypogeohydataceae bacterium YC38]
MAGALTIIVAALGGAALGGGIGFGAQFLLEKRKERKIKEGFINLLICDISSLLKLYNESIGEAIKRHNNEENIFHNYLRVRHNYFSVFDNNSDKILYLDDETSRLVVQFYNHAKAHMDSIDCYNEYLQDHYLKSSLQKGVPWE